GSGPGGGDPTVVVAHPLAPEDRAHRRRDGVTIAVMKSWGIEPRLAALAATAVAVAIACGSNRGATGTQAGGTAGAGPGSVGHGGGRGTGGAGTGGAGTGGSGGNPAGGFVTSASSGGGQGGGGTATCNPACAPKTQVCSHGACVPLMPCTSDNQCENDTRCVP